MAIIKAVKDAYRQGTGVWNVPMLALRARYLYGQQRPAVRAVGEGLVAGSSLAGALLTNAAYDLSSPETLVAFLAGVVGGSVLSGLGALVRPLTGLTGLAYPTKTFGKKGFIKISGEEFKVSKDLQEGSEFEKVFSDTKSEIGMIVETAGEDGKISLRDFLNAMDGKISVEQALVLYTQITAKLLALGGEARVLDFFDDIMVDNNGEIDIVTSDESEASPINIYSANKKLFKPLLGEAANFDKQGRVFRKILGKLRKAFKNKKIKDQNIVVPVLLRLLAEYNIDKNSNQSLTISGFQKDPTMELSAGDIELVSSDEETDKRALRGKASGDDPTILEDGFVADRRIKMLQAFSEDSADFWSSQYPGFKQEIETLISQSKFEKAQKLIEVLNAFIAAIENMLIGRKRAEEKKNIQALEDKLAAAKAALAAGQKKSPEKKSSAAAKKTSARPAGKVPAVKAKPEAQKTGREIMGILSKAELADWNKIKEVVGFYMSKETGLKADLKKKILGYFGEIIKYFSENKYPARNHTKRWALLVSIAEICVKNNTQKKAAVAIIKKARELGITKEEGK